MKQRRDAILASALSALVAALSFVAGRQSVAQEDSDSAASPELVSARVVEVLDEHGVVVARLGSNEVGGMLELFRHKPKVGDRTATVHRFLYAGATSAQHAELRLSSNSTAPWGGDEPEPTAFVMAIDGEAGRASLRGVDQAGQVAFELRTADKDEWALRLGDGEGGIRFEK